MIETIKDTIRRFVAGNPGNCFPGGNGRFFDEPLIGFASADDPIFTEYKQVIGCFHRTPREVLDSAATVIVWSLPITQATRESNRRENRWPSRQWAVTRNDGEGFNVALRKFMVGWLEERGHKALSPQLSPDWQQLDDPRVGVASTWSDRHAAYAAGLGTFSLNDALIASHGIAHRLGSVVTDLRLPATPRTAPSLRHNCLYHREGSCGACISRCPVGALSRNGHDKNLCRSYVYGSVPEAVGELYQTPQTGCGLCQTRVPCESGIPPGRNR